MSGDSNGNSFNRPAETTEQQPPLWGLLFYPMERDGSTWGQRA